MNIKYELLKIGAVRNINYVIIFLFCANLLLCYYVAGNPPYNTESVVIISSDSTPELTDTVTTTAEYISLTDRIIEKAQQNLNRFAIRGIPENSYSYKYQERIIVKYKVLQTDVKIGDATVSGWDEYFDYRYGDIFIFAALTVICSLVFTQEKNNGILPIIRVSKNGRGKTAGIKIGAAFLFSAGIVSAFTLSAWLIFYIRAGFKGTDNVLQAVPGFALTPYAITVWQYFICTLLLKLLTFAVYTVLVLLISVFIYNYVLIYLSALVLVGFNFLFYTLSYINADNIFRNLNLFAAAAADPMFIRYRSINVFGSVVGSVPFMCAVFGLLLAAAVTVTVIKYSRGSAAVNVMWISRLILRIHKNIDTATTRFHMRKARRIRVYSRSVFLAEVFKTLVSSRYIIILLVLLFVKVYISSDTFSARNSMRDDIYRQYMTEFEGAMSDEKSVRITAEKNYINTTLSAEENMKNKFIKRKISVEEYGKYTDAYNDAFARSSCFPIIEAHMAYLEQTAAEKGVDAHFVYDTGWKLLLGSGFDVILYMAILLLFARVFADEYNSKSSSGSFAQILRTTKNGRSRTFLSKIISAVIITVALTAIFNAVDYMTIQHNYELPDINAPLISVQMFADIDSGITIAQYLAVFFAIHILAAILLTFVVCGVSELFRKNIPVIAVVVTVTLFPALFVYFGLPVFGYMDYTKFFAATPLILLSAEGGADWRFAAVFIGIAMVITTGITVRAKTTWEM